MEWKYFTTSDYNKFKNERKLNKKGKELLHKSDISNLAKLLNVHLTKNLKILVTKAELKVEQGKTVKLQTNELSYFLDKNIFGYDVSQSMFFYQLTLNTLELKENKDIDYVINWKLKGVYSSKLKPLYTAFFHSIKLSGYGMRTKFDKDTLTVEQSNYATKIVNAYIVYD